MEAVRTDSKKAKLLNAIAIIECFAVAKGETLDSLDRAVYREIRDDAAGDLTGDALDRTTCKHPVTADTPGGRGVRDARSLDRMRFSTDIPAG